MAGFQSRADEARARQSGLKEGKSALARRAAQPPMQCPECGSLRIWRDGVRHTGHGDVQRWLCRDCGFRFSQTIVHGSVKPDVAGHILEGSNPGKNFAEVPILNANFSRNKTVENPSLPSGEDVASHGNSLVTIVGKDLNSLRHYNRERRVRVSEAEAKNLAEVKSQTGMGQREATTQTSADVKGKIVEFAWWMQKEGYAPSTITGRVYKIKRLANLGANLLDPESVKEVIARQTTWSNGAKKNATVSYSSFLKMLGLEWEAPRHKVPETLPFIPLESEIDALINGCGKKMACFLQGLKDTGADPGELARLEWTDVNYEAKSVTIRHPVKGHSPRVMPVSDAFLKRLNSMPKNEARIFRTVRGLQSNLNIQRRHIARNLSNPRMLKITFITFRHWKGTTEYHKTKDILHVKQLLGHKQIQSTMIYINLEAAIFTAESDEFTVRVAKTLNEACQLLEVGFEYVCDMEGAKLFRKRK